MGRGDAPERQARDARRSSIEGITRGFATRGTVLVWRNCGLGSCWQEVQSGWQLAASEPIDDELPQREAVLITTQRQKRPGVRRGDRVES